MAYSEPPRKLGSTAQTQHRDRHFCNARCPFRPSFVGKQRSIARSG